MGEYQRALVDAVAAVHFVAAFDWSRARTRGVAACLNLGVAEDQERNAHMRIRTHPLKLSSGGFEYLAKRIRYLTKTQTIEGGIWGRLLIACSLIPGKAAHGGGMSTRLARIPRNKGLGSLGDHDA
eukprot:5523525-Amphidinium_carterae.1